MPTAIAAVAVARRGPSGHPQWLVAQRLPTARLGGFWEWPGGKVEVGESPPQAAARELMEEVDLRIEAAALRTVGPAIEAGPITIELFWTIAPPGAAPRAIGCTQVRWIEASQLASLQFPPANAPLTERIVQLDLALRAGTVGLD